MAKNVLEAKMNIAHTAIAVGKQIIDVVTTSMYSNPLMILREYIQNAVDAIDEAVERKILQLRNATVDVRISGHDRTLTVQDNGVGVGNAKVEEVLCSLGHSTKEDSGLRGFRGIGRCGGMGYCDKVQFETRSSAKERVAVVEWDCQRLRKMVRQKAKRLSAKKVIHAAVTMIYRKASAEDPARFFRVTMRGVHRFHKDQLMNIPAVTSYLGQVAPVAFDCVRFPFAAEIEDHLAEIDGYRCYNIRLNGRKIYRPHTTTVKFGTKQTDQIRGIELFDIRGRDGSRVGHGWYAHTRYLGSIPACVAMRGIRIRQGNIEIGDEYCLEDIYAERRFSTWHIGEIHVDYSLKANARRDGFEQSPDYEAFLEQTNMLGRHLSRACRISSKNRSARLAAGRLLQRAEFLLNRAFFVDEDHLNQTRAEVKRLIRKLGALEQMGQLDPGFASRVALARQMLGKQNENARYLPDVLDGRSLRHMEHKELLQAVARAIIENHDANATAEQLLPRILYPYLRRDVAEAVAAERRFGD